MEGLIPTSDDGKSDVHREHLMKIIIMSVMWSLGAILELADRKLVRLTHSTYALCFSLVLSVLYCMIFTV